MAGGNVMYPVMLNISGKKCVIIGGGKTALRKARKLAASGAAVTAVSPNFCGGFDCAEKIQKRYDKSDIIGAFLVIVATDNKSLNRQIAADAREKNILVSLADDAEHSDFISAASAAAGDLTVSVSTNGKLPLLAKRLCAEKSADIDFYNSILPLLEKYRQIIIANHGDTKQELINYMLSDEMLEIARRDTALFEDKIKEKIQFCERI